MIINQFQKYFIIILNLNFLIYLLNMQMNKDKHVNKSLKKLNFSLIFNQFNNKIFFLYYFNIFLSNLINSKIIIIINKHKSNFNLKKYTILGKLLNFNFFFHSIYFSKHNLKSEIS